MVPSGPHVAPRGCPSVVAILTAGPPVIGDPLHRRSREKPDPLAVRRDEYAARVTNTARATKTGQNGRLELVERAHEQLIAAAIHDP